MLALASVQSPAALQLQTLARTAASGAVWALTCRLADIKPLALGDDVVIGESNGRGSGIFAERDLLPGEILGRYSGKLLSEAQYQAAWAAGETSGDYAFELGDSEWLVGGKMLPRRAGCAMSTTRSGAQTARPSRATCSERRTPSIYRPCNQSHGGMSASSITAVAIGTGSSARAIN